MEPRRQRLRRFGAIVAAFAAVVALVLVTSVRRDDPLDAIERSIQPACPGVIRSSRALSILPGSYGATGDHTTEHDASECLAAIRSALTETGWPEGRADAVVRADSGSDRVDNVMALKHTEEVTFGNGETLGAVFVDILDCRRALVETDTNAWAGGLSTDLFLYSPCDQEHLPAPELVVVTRPGSG